MKETLTKQQWLIMEALWTRHPMFLSELMESMEGKVNWTHTTFLTYLKKMIQEGYISYETIRGSRSYSPAISQEDCMIRESRSLMSRMTRGSAKMFVSNMIKEGSLTKQDRDELKDLIGALEEEAAEEDD